MVVAFLIIFLDLLLDRRPLHIAILYAEDFFLTGESLTTQLTEYLIANPVWLQIVPTTALAYYTYRSVKHSERNVDATEHHIKEIQKDRLRSNVRQVIINDLFPLREALSDHKYRIEKVANRLRRVSMHSIDDFPELEEWDLNSVDDDSDNRDLNDIIIDIQRLSPDSEVGRFSSKFEKMNVADQLKQYRELYNDYIQKRKLIQDRLMVCLDNDNRIGRILNDANWEQINSPSERHRTRSRPSTRAEKLSKQRQSDENKVKQAQAHRYLKHNAESVANRIMRGNSDIMQKKPYDQIISQIRDGFDNDFERLDQIRSELWDVYDCLLGEQDYRSHGSINKLITHLKYEYDIYNIGLTPSDDEHEEVEEEITENSNENSSNSNIEEFEIQDGSVYIVDEEYDESFDDVSSDDFENYAEFIRAKENATPGTRYNTIRILPNGWIECVDIIFSPELDDDPSYSTTTYPPHMVDRIESYQRNNARKSNE